MPKYFAFPVQKASGDRPALLRAVRVWGDAEEQGTKQHGGAALKVLIKAMKDDPKLKNDHPEFLSPEDRSKLKPKTPSKSSTTPIKK